MVVQKLLFIEDDDHIRTALRLALEDEGYAITEAVDGITGLKAFDLDSFDLVLLDLRLPDLSGFEVCRLLRAKSLVPIIIVTAQTDTHDLVAGLEAGADDYVTKPVIDKELAARIRAALRRTTLTSSMPGSNDRFTVRDIELRLEIVWGYEYLGDSRLVDAHIRRLRVKIEDSPDDPKIIVTVRGMGYRLLTA